MLTAWAGISDPNLLQEVFIVGLAGGLVLWDARRRDEDLFLANLSVPSWAIVVMGACGALPLELWTP